MLKFRLFNRLSWRRIALFGSGCALFLFLVFTLTPIIAPLPRYTGPHEVGVLDIETEVERRVVFSEAVLKESGVKAFELNTLAITLYYPSIPRPPGSSGPQPLARPWLPQPLAPIGTGYARMLGIYWRPLQLLLTGTLWALGSKTVIPGIVDAPLIPATEVVLVSQDGDMHEPKGSLIEQAENAKNDSEKLELRSNHFGARKLPLVVFSHGMAGMSQSYSHYLGSIASHGYVVAAVEHRDGSGPGSIVHFANGTSKPVWHVQLHDLEADPPMTLSQLKTAQLAFRESEMLETIRLFRRLNAGAGTNFTNLKPDSPETSLPGFENRLDLDAVTVIGHSYGATGILQALKGARDKETPLNGGIALDPGKASGPLNHDIDVPLLVMQSGEWTDTKPDLDFYGQGPHFSVVQRLVRGVKKGWFKTLRGTAHPSCTDAPLIVPWIMKMVMGTTLEARTALEEYIDVSVGFLEFLRTGKGPTQMVLQSGVTSEWGPLGEEGKRGVVRGEKGGEWEVHAVPRG
ncbi:uncharacterized protein EI97DRAFT_435789 [Westerdykella ornata]|uniref:Putative phospholipase n=1 Tax=Westerdykella ornata TaxID=318751 RepID=A0A6A6JCC9_WESOR|nr:uncharacterized protein EI97DRAFT_435789 [Westerdykella ornata]KAF2273874.1 hypothetical protein EI97DRAFT_435789 [Westerdykella ornata]